MTTDTSPSATGPGTDALVGPDGDGNGDVGVAGGIGVRGTTGGQATTAENRDDHAAPVIELRNVVKRYETGGETLEALKGVDFAAAPGEFVAIMGPSGSGKSTMLNVLGLLDAPTEGTVLLDGRDVTDLSDKELTRERRRSIGFVFQQFYLIPTLTATENVELPTLFDDDDSVGGTGNADDVDGDGDGDGDGDEHADSGAGRQRAEGLLRRVGLGDRLDHRPNQLSGGQKQRVAIARALVNSPRVLLADEPTGNLDRATGESVLELFDEIRRERDVAVIAVTHDPQVSAFADRTVYLVDGELGDRTLWVEA